MNTISNKKLIGFAAYSGTGKTTLIKLIVKILNKSNFKVSVIKHAHHDFDVDKAGKDSYEIRKSGAENMLISSAKRWALMHENTNNSELKLSDLINVLDTLDSDIILVNWSAYSIYDSLGESKKAKNSLENAYFEIKSKSKEIKNKDDRKLYLSTEMNKNILSRWKSI